MKGLIAVANSTMVWQYARHANWNVEIGGRQTSSKVHLIDIRLIHLQAPNEAAIRDAISK